uniref:(northern house mosquito) hypothetical protein n=1 Tax=Culex pipiens TaxID=7175 RepID=A0A8D8BZZ5_CULPI
MVSLATLAIFRFLPRSLSFSVVYSVLIKMSPNNFIYMIVACSFLCLFVCVCVLLSLMDLSQPSLGWGPGPLEMPRWTRTWISIYFEFISFHQWGGAAKQLAHFVTMVSHRQKIFEKSF